MPSWNDTPFTVFNTLLKLLSASSLVIAQAISVCFRFGQVIFYPFPRQMIRQLVATAATTAICGNHHGRRFIVFRRELWCRVRTRFQSAWQGVGLQRAKRKLQRFSRYPVFSVPAASNGKLVCSVIHAGRRHGSKVRTAAGLKGLCARTLHGPGFAAGRHVVWAGMRASNSLLNMLVVETHSEYNTRQGVFRGPVTVLSPGGCSG